jgi:signal peptidase
MTSPGDDEHSDRQVNTDETADTGTDTETGGSAGTDTRENQPAEADDSDIGGDSQRTETQSREKWRSDDGPETEGGPERADETAEWKKFTWDIVTSVLAVTLVGFYLFAISGVWPPMVAIESGSMEPNMEKNDLVFVTDTDRFQPAESQEGTGIVTAEVGAETGYKQFGNPGDIIVYAPDGETDEVPIIHRAMFWVEEGESWCDRANEEYLQGTNGCSEAENSGFITKGDANGEYDQVGSRPLSSPVQPDWIIGTAERRVPGLGWLRLQLQ